LQNYNQAHKNQNLTIQEEKEEEEE